MSKVLKSSALIICVLFVWAEAVSAQSRASDNVGFSVNVRVDTTDNRDSVPDAYKESNVDIYVAPRINLDFDWREGSMLFHYMPAFRHRSDASDIQNDNEWQHDLGIRLKRELSERLKVKLSERYNFTDDPSIDEEGGELVRDSSYTLNRLSGVAEYRITKPTRAKLSVYNLMKDYDESLRSIQSDVNKFTGRLLVWRRVTRTTGISVSGAMRSCDYSKKNEDEWGKRGFETTTGTVGLEQMLGADLRSSLEIGSTSVDYDSADIASYSTPYVMGSLKGKLGAMTELTLAAGHMLRDSYVFPYSSQEETMFSGTLRLHPDEKVELSLGVTLRHGEYELDKANTTPDLDATPAVESVYYDALDMQGTAPEGDEDSTEFSAGVTYNIDDSTSLNIRQRFEDVDSEVDISFVRNTTSLAFLRKF